MATTPGWTEWRITLHNSRLQEINFETGNGVVHKEPLTLRFIPQLLINEEEVILEETSHVVRGLLAGHALDVLVSALVKELIHEDLVLCLAKMFMATSHNPAIIMLRP